LQQTYLRRMRRDDGESLSAKGARRTGGQGPPDRGERYVFERRRRRAGGDARFCHRHKLWRLGPAQGRRSGSRITIVAGDLENLHSPTPRLAESYGKRVPLRTSKGKTATASAPSF